MTNEPHPPITHAMWPSVAYHEAGHAVAHIAFRWWGLFVGDPAPPPAFLTVQINPDGCGETFGFVQGGGPYIARGYTTKKKPVFEDEDERGFVQQDAIEAIICSLAGPFAEAVFHGYRDPFDMAMEAASMGEGSSDYEDAELVYSDLKFLMPRRPDWGRIEDRTTRLVLDNWSAIEALAERLLVKHELEFDEALAIVAPFLASADQAASASPSALTGFASPEM